MNLDLKSSIHLESGSRVLDSFILNLELKFWSPLLWIWISRFGFIYHESGSNVMDSFKLNLDLKSYIHLSWIWILSFGFTYLKYVSQVLYSFTSWIWISSYGFIFIFKLVHNYHKRAIYSNFNVLAVKSWLTYGLAFISQNND